MIAMFFALPASAGPVQFAIAHREEIVDEVARTRELRACGANRTWTTWEDPDGTGARFSHPAYMAWGGCPMFAPTVWSVTSLTAPTCSVADSAITHISVNVAEDDRALMGLTFEEFIDNEWGWSNYPIISSTIDGYNAVTVINDGYPEGTGVSFVVVQVDKDGVLWELTSRLQDNHDNQDLTDLFWSGAIECTLHVQ